jgi:hypothetical protein
MSSLINRSAGNLAKANPFKSAGNAEPIFSHRIAPALPTFESVVKPVRMLVETLQLSRQMLLGTALQHFVPKPALLVITLPRAVPSANFEPATAFEAPYLEHGVIPLYSEQGWSYGHEDYSRFRQSRRPLALLSLPVSRFDDSSRLRRLSSAEPRMSSSTVLQLPQSANIALAVEAESRLRRVNRVAEASEAGLLVPRMMRVSSLGDLGEYSVDTLNQEIAPSLRERASMSVMTKALLVTGVVAASTAVVAGALWRKWW